MKIKKKLYRDNKNGMIAGVCAGLADYFDIDVLALRILWFVLALFFGSGIFIYLAAMLIIPNAPKNQNEIEMVEETANKNLFLSGNNKIIGGVCGGIGEYYNIDANIIRLIFIVLSFIYGTGILLYILFYLFIPNE